MPEKIDIIDLVNPVLNEIQQTALTHAEANPVTLDTRSVLQAASDATGLTDFGDDAFRERLDLWMAETRADEDQTEFGRTIIYGMAVTYARNRLRIEDMVARHPEILDIEIDRPIVVAGLPRSGTTHLQNFLSADPRLRELPMWEAMAPVPGPEDEPTPDDPNPRRSRAYAEWDQIDAIMPLTKAIHEMSPDYVSEDVELQSLDFGSYNLEWRVYAPNWRDFYLGMDHTPVYRYMKKALQVLTFLRGPNRWVIKCPQHMEQLVPLFDVFPDATVAITHRDPVASIQSALTGICYFSRISRKRVDADKHASYWIDRYQRLLERCVRDRDKVPEGQVVDVYFDKLVQDPMNVIEEIYQKARLPFTDEIRQGMYDFLANNPRGKHGQIVYNLRRDFGVEPAEIRKRFAKYFERFPVREEVA